MAMGPVPQRAPALRRPRIRASTVLAVAAGGAAGGTIRALFVMAFPVGSGAFPWVILVENLLGAFLLGLVLTLVLDRKRLPADVQAMVTTGVLASFTTFSNYSVDVVALVAGGAWGLAFGYGVASPALGLAAALAGMGLGRSVGGAR